MEEKKNNALAITSLVLSLIGLVVFGIPCGIGAIVTGIIGLVKFKPEKEKGKGMAIAGIVVGVADIIMVLIFIGIKATSLVAQ